MSFHDSNVLELLVYTKKLLNIDLWLWHSQCHYDDQFNNDASDPLLPTHWLSICTKATPNHLKISVLIHHKGIHQSLMKEQQNVPSADI